MKNLENYLDDLKEKTGSDNKSAKELGVDRSTIANIRRRNLISDETAIKLADALSIDRSEILIAAAIARSNGEVKTAWENISKRTGITASIFISASLSAQGLEALLWMIEKAGNKGILYIMLNAIVNALNAVKNARTRNLSGNIFNGNYKSEKIHCY